MISDSLFAEQKGQSWASLVCAAGTFGGVFPQAQGIAGCVAAVDRGSSCGEQMWNKRPGFPQTFYGLLSFYLSEIFFKQFFFSKEFISWCPTNSINHIYDATKIHKKCYWEME